MHLAGHTQGEIAKAVGLSQQRIDKVLQLFEKLQMVVDLDDLEEFASITDDDERKEAIRSKYEPIANHEAEFTPQLYNVWTKSANTNSIDHFGK